MKRLRHSWKVLVYVVSILSMTGCVTISMEGCSLGIDEDETTEIGKELQANLEQVEEERRVDVDADMVLAEGQILKVRLHYGDETLDTEAWYKVRIDNPRNNWYDYVEWTAYHGFGGGTKNYDDCDFYAENFNKQVTSEHYDPADVDGIYIMTVSGSNGYQMEKNLTWDSSQNDGRGGWSNEGSSMMAFSVP